MASNQRTAGCNLIAFAGAWFGFFLLALVIYWPAVHGPFIWDDSEMLNAAVRSSDGLLAIWSGKQVDYFPITSTLFWVESRLWNNDPAGYRIINIALHAGCAALLWQILKRLRVPGAAVAGLLFCFHPVCVASVAWIAELKNTLSAFFALFAVFFFLRAEKTEPNDGAKFATSDYIFSLVAFLFALLSKISVVMLPVVLLACTNWRRLPNLLRVAPFFGLSLILGIVNVVIHQNHAMNLATNADIEPLTTRLLGGGYAVWFYLWKAIVPIGLMPIYPRWPINPASLLDWVPLLLWCCLLVACWILSRRFYWGRLSFYGLAFFWVMLLPVLGVVQISYFFITRAGDHLQYFPVIGVIAIIGAFCDAIAQFVLSKTRATTVPERSSRGQMERARSNSSTIYAVMMAIVLLPFAGAAWVRANLYADPARLWRKNVEKNPGAAMAWANLGAASHAVERDDEALTDYSESLKLDPRNIVVRENYAGVFNSMGRHDEAIAQYREILSQQNNYTPVHLSLGATLAGEGKFTDAAREFETAIQLAPDNADAHNNLGAMYGKLAQYDKAVSEFELVLKLNPHHASADGNLNEAKRLRDAPVAAP